MKHNQAEQPEALACYVLAHMRLTDKKETIQRSPFP